jgi:glutathione S-transferase
MTSGIVLYGNQPVTSPYVMAVFVALEEKGLPFEFLKLDLKKGEHHDPAYLKQSITNRVPTLRCDGHTFSESSAITEYLEERFPPPQYARLYPADIVERARVRMVQALIRSDFMPIRIERSTDTFFQNAPIQPLSAEATEAKRRLERIALDLVGDGRNYIASEFSIADVDLSTLLQRLSANKDPMPQVLTDYANGIWARPSVRKWLSLTDYAA